MKNLNIIVTAGSTREYIDPVRFISNASTAHMGHEIAKEAKARKHNVLLISGPTFLKPLKKIKCIHIETAKQLKGALLKHYKWADCVIMTAAVSDFTPIKYMSKKIKRKKKIKLHLKPTEDILELIGKRKGYRILVGFCLESANIIKNALEKMKKKNLDIIVANKIARNYIPFGFGIKEFFFIDKRHAEVKRITGTKTQLAKNLLSKIEQLTLMARYPSRKGAVCKTVMRGCNSHPRLQLLCERAFE